MIIGIILLSILTNYIVQCNNPCSYIVRDTIFIVDASESISKDDFKLSQEFVVSMMTFLKSSNPENRIAFVIFGDSANVVFNFDKYNDLADMVKEVRQTRNENSLTAIGKALNITLVEIVPKMRKNVETLAILFTDGRNNLYPSPYLYADKLKDEHISILTMGIGSEISEQELTKIASENMVKKVESFKDLMSKLSDLTSSLCPLPDPAPNIPCKLNQQDLVVLLDSSESINATDYERAKVFLSALFMKFDLGVDKVRLAMISFSDELRLDFDFDNQDKIFEKLSSLEKFGTATAIGQALRETLVTLKPKQRPGVPFNILLITDGFNNMYPRPQSVAQKLKQEQANIITLGIGDEINFNELKAISSDDKVLTVEDFDKLLDSLKTVLKTITCG